MGWMSGMYSLISWISWHIFFLSIQVNATLGLQPFLLTFLYVLLHHFLASIVSYENKMLIWFSFFIRKLCFYQNLYLSSPLYSRYLSIFIISLNLFLLFLFFFNYSLPSFQNLIILACLVSWIYSPRLLFIKVPILVFLFILRYLCQSSS